VLGAFFGVQSSVVRERDFQHGQPWWVYAITAVCLTALLVLFLVWLAKVVVWKNLAN